MDLLRRTAALMGATAAAALVVAAAATATADAAPVPATPSNLTSAAAVAGPQTLYDGYFVTNDLSYPLVLLHDDAWTKTANGWGAPPPERLEPGQTYYFEVTYWFGYLDDSAATWVGPDNFYKYQVYADGSRTGADTYSSTYTNDPRARMMTIHGSAYGQSSFFIQPAPKTVVAGQR